MGALLLALVAAMTLFVVEHNIAQAQESEVATLNSLIVQSGENAGVDAAALALMPAFESDAAPAAGGYVVYVANDVIGVTVRAGATHTRATVAITADTTDSSQNINLGGNTTTVVKVKVTAQDGFTAETYTINVMRASDSTSTTATLSSLSLTAGGSDLTLMPPFMPDGAPAQDGWAWRRCIRRDIFCGGERGYQSYGRYGEDLVWDADG